MRKIVLTAYGDKHKDLLDRCKKSLPDDVIHSTQFDWGNGKAWAMNNLIKNLNDDDIVFLIDADDMAYPEWFEADRLALLKDYDLVYGDCLNATAITDQDVFGKYFWSRPFWTELLKRENYIPYSTVIVKGWLLKKVGYDDTPHVGDWMTWHKMLQHTNKFVYYPGVCCIRDTSTSYFDTGNKYVVWLKRKIRNYFAKRNIKKIWNSTHE